MNIHNKPRRYISSSIIICTCMLVTSFLLYEFTGIAYAQDKVHVSKLLTPQLLPMYPDKLVWIWRYPNPYRWKVYISVDQGRTFFLIEDYWAYGYSRRFAPDGGGELMYIVGVDQSGQEITAHSNIVRPDDAPIPKKKRIYP